MTNFNIVGILQPITKAFALTFQGIPSIEGVDTRRLTKVIRSKGTMLGRLVVADPTKHKSLEQALQEASKTPIHDPAKFNLVEQVSIKVRNIAIVATKSSYVTLVLIFKGHSNSA